jgi:hypothetical protein
VRRSALTAFSAACLLASLASCQTPARAPFVVHLVTANGGSPFATCSTGTVHVSVRQGDTTATMAMAMLSAGTLSTLDVNVSSYTALTQISVTADCTGAMGTRTLVGATTPFVPVGYGFVNVVMGEPGHCDLLSAPTLAQGRIAPATVAVGSNVVAIGGVDASGTGTAVVQLLDPITLTYSGSGAMSFEDLSIQIGRARALEIGSSTLLFALSNEQSFLYDVGPNAGATRLTAASVHAGAGYESALLRLDDGSFVAAGGLANGTAVDGLTRGDANGTLTADHLLVARRQPALAVLGNTLVVAGGVASGMPAFESSGAGQLPATFGSGDVRFGGVLARDAIASRALLLLGADAPEAGHAVASTAVIAMCPPCTVTPGPTLTSPRLDVAALEHTIGTVGGGTQRETLLVGGTDASGATSALVERVVFDGNGTPSVQPSATLAVPRRQPGVTDIGLGVVLVTGGADDHGNALGSTEICFPEALVTL